MQPGDLQSAALSNEVPAIEECWTTIDGARLHYQCGGSGPALVLLHGLLGYSFSWRFNILPLARCATVYAVDMPGVGFSDRCPMLDCSFRGSAGRLLGFAQQVGLSSFDLVGTSHGGAVAMMAAAMANQPGAPHVRRLILVAPVNPWSAHGTRLSTFLSGRAVAVLFRRLAPYGQVAHGQILRRLYGDPRRISPGTLEGYAKPFVVPGSFDYGLRVLGTWNADLQELRSMLPKIVDIPTLLVWGGRDAAVNPASAQFLHQQFRNCRLAVFDGVGHLPYEEVPDQFNTEVLEFLANTCVDTV